MTVLTKGRYTTFNLVNILIYQIQFNVISVPEQKFKANSETIEPALQSKIKQWLGRFNKESTHQRNVKSQIPKSPAV